MKRVLTIAGSDSGGGAGIQADLKVYSSLGVYGLSAITAITAQNTVSIRSIFPLAPQFIADQIDCVLEDFGADAVKVGMLLDIPTIQVVAKRLRFHNVKKIVVDPVMIAKTGDSLLLREAIQVFKDELFPLAYILTPNLMEGEKLLKRKIETPAEMEEAGRDLRACGVRNVLIKGGHSSSSACTDVFVGESETFSLSVERVDSRNTHGTGCTLSSSIAAFLALGMEVGSAVRASHSYVQNALVRGRIGGLGKGDGPLLNPISLPLNFL